MKTRVRQAGAKWRSPSRKQRPSNNAWVNRLAPLEQVREPFLACHQAIVRDVLAEHFDGANRVVELGAGLGQLHRWLPHHKPGHWVHTDPDAGTLRELRARFPDASVVNCSVERLPFENESCSVVIAVCLLDLVGDLDAALREIHRVLEPGGRLVHLLDMSASLETLFHDVATSDKLVLPNLFGDPSSSTFPEDILVSERAPMRMLLARLEERGHPLPQVFGHYFRAFAAVPFDAAATARAYDALSRTPDMRKLLAAMLTNAYTTGFQLGLPPPRGVLRSSSRHFAERLADSARRTGLTPLHDAVRFAWSHATAGESGECYRSLVLGHERRMSIFPDTLLCPEAPLPQDGDALLEAGVHTFVAQK